MDRHSHLDRLTTPCWPSRTRPPAYNFGPRVFGPWETHCELGPAWRTEKERHTDTHGVGGPPRVCAPPGPSCVVKSPSRPPRTALGSVSKKGSLPVRPALTALPKLQRVSHDVMSQP